MRLHVITVKGKSAGIPFALTMQIPRVCNSGAGKRAGTPWPVTCGDGAAFAPCASTSHGIYSWWFYNLRLVTQEEKKKKTEKGYPLSDDSWTPKGTPSSSGWGVGVGGWWWWCRCCHGDPVGRQAGPSNWASIFRKTLEAKRPLPSRDASTLSAWIKVCFDAGDIKQVFPLVKTGRETHSLPKSKGNVNAVHLYLSAFYGSGSVPLSILWQ